MPTALDTIRAELRNDVASGFHAGENGGLLLGRPTRHAVVVLEATGPGPAAIREPDGIPIDYFHNEQIAAQRKLEIVGAWHFHPRDGLDDVSAPSEDDLTAAARHLRTLSVDKRQIGWTYGELIISASRLDAWTIPSISAWTFAMGQSDWDPVAVERADVEPGMVEL